MSAVHAEAFLDKVAGDELLRRQLAASDEAAWVLEGARAGLAFTADELREARQRRAAPLELTDEQLSSVAGGAGAILNQSVRDLGSYPTHPTFPTSSLDHELGVKKPG